MKLVWVEDTAEGPDGRTYMLDVERVRGEPPAWSVLVAGEGPTPHRRIRVAETNGRWPTKGRARRAAQLDADRIEAEAVAVGDA